MGVFLFKAVFVCILIISTGALSSCQASTDTAINAKVDESGSNITPFLSVLDRFSCKPPRTSFIAAHRGTDKTSPFPENALESLKALHAKQVLFAEIDIARLKDGTLILYHDGMWDRGSTGTGPISKSTWRQSQKYLLKDAQGRVTSFRPSAFKDVLIWAKDKIYLEIDFKSSVNEAKVIKAVAKAGMLDQVILISYSRPQALRLHKLAPKTAISIKIKKIGDIKAYEIAGVRPSVITAWTGSKPPSKQFARQLRAHNIPRLSSQDYRTYKSINELPDLIVTDFAFDAQQAFVIAGENLKTYEKCLAKKSRNK